MHTDGGSDLPSAQNPDSGAVEPDGADGGRRRRASFSRILHSKGAADSQKRNACTRALKIPWRRDGARAGDAEGVCAGIPTDARPGW